jgi:hypothetical protein
VGKTLAEATVFSSPVAPELLIVSDERGGKRLGLAVANDMDADQTATISVFDTSSLKMQGTTSRHIAAHSSVVGFLDELTGYSGAALAQVTISCDVGCAAIGLRFADSVFTTIPAMINASSTTAPPPPPPPDTTPPTVSITSPASGTTVSGNVTVSGTASDNVGVTAVQVRVDSGSFSNATGTNNWTFGINTKTLSDGSHTVSAQATDAAGNLSAIATITMNVNNSPPPPPPPSSLCSSTPPPDSSGNKPFNQTQTEKLCGKWTFTWQVASLVGVEVDTFNQVSQNPAQPGGYMASGTRMIQGISIVGVMYGGYDPVNQRFWAGPTATVSAARFTFNFVDQNDVTGCAWDSLGRCTPMTGARTQ